MRFVATSSPRKMSRKAYPRTARLNSLFHQEIARWVREEWEHPIKEAITITRAETSTDGSHLKIYYLLPKEQESDLQIQEVQKSLEEAAPQLYGYLLKNLHLRRIPQLHFRYDFPYAKGTEVNIKIFQMMQARQKNEP